jgi:parvulin-like peptidyl-prolyl isomerase
MPRTKKEVKKLPPKKKTSAPTTQSRKKESKEKASFNLAAYYSVIRKNFSANRKIYTRYFIITIVVALLGLFVYLKKDWFVAAVVNNQPITTLELYQNLKAKDGQAVLDQLIRDRLINQEAAKKGITVSSDEIDKKIESIKKQLGGKEALDTALSQRNLSQDDFKKQIRVQILVEKLLADQIKVSDKEVEDYIAKNPVETKDQTKDEVRSQLRSTKLNEKFTTWYENLQKNSKIYKFI